jgi:hypothetical protein
MFVAWTGSLSATSSIPLNPLPITSNGRGTHSFVPSTGRNTSVISSLNSDLVGATLGSYVVYELDF